MRTADMAQAGRNPGRIIGTVLTAFVREHSGQRVRIIGEPIWAGRTADEYPACAEHEALINVALGEHPPTSCAPTTCARLDREWLTDATRTHPTLAADGDRWESPAYTDPVARGRLVRPAARARAARGRRARHRPHHRAPAPPGGSCTTTRRPPGMSEGRLPTCALAVQELVVNTVVHAGGSGLLMIWTAGRQVVCQVQDGGRITDPLVGRRPPAPPEVGHGLFTVHQVCDLVRVHRRRDGTLVRIHVNFD